MTMRYMKKSGKSGCPEKMRNKDLQGARAREIKAPGHADRPQTFGLPTDYPAACLNSAGPSHIFAPPCANACAVFRRCGRLLGVASRLQPLRSLRFRTALR